MAFDKKRVLNRLDVLSRKAEELNQLAAAVRCEELLGRSLGMFLDRSRVEMSFSDALESADAAEFKAYVAEMKQRRDAATQTNQEDQIN